MFFLRGLYSERLIHRERLRLKKAGEFQGIVIIFRYLAHNQSPYAQSTGFSRRWGLYMARVFRFKSLFFNSRGAYFLHFTIVYPPNFFSI